MLLNGVDDLNIFDPPKVRWKAFGSRGRDCRETKCSFQVNLELAIGIVNAGVRALEQLKLGKCSADSWGEVEAQIVRETTERCAASDEVSVRDAAQF
jgi:hypothetical protein